jgi:hypothetical protein
LMAWTIPTAIWDSECRRPVLERAW